MNHKNLCLLCMVLLTGFPLAAGAGSLPGKTRTNGRDVTLQKDVSATIFGYEHKVVAASKHPRIIDTAVMVTARTFKVDPNGLIVGKWVESWVVRRDDGTKQTYLVRFDAHGAAGTGFAIKPYNGKPKN